MSINPTRRSIIGLSMAAVATAALSACAPTTRGTATPGITRIMPTDPLVAAYEAKRKASGNTLTQTLKAGAFDTTIAGKQITTWGYNNALVAPTLRASVGDQLKLEVANQLMEGTSIHWHGLALRNDADGVPGLTQDEVPAGSNYGYDFNLSHPGTYWYHSHVEMQRERALYGALIIEDPNETLEYDRDWVIVLDDWMDGITGTPDDVMKELSGGMGDMGSMHHGSGDGPMSMGHMMMGTSSDYLGGDTGDVAFPLHLFNGTAPDQPEVFNAKAGEKIRLRIINAAGDTAYRIGIPDQKITLTHTDGFPVKHTDVDAVILGMGERIDALITVAEGNTAVMALAEGKDQTTFGLISTGSGKAPRLADLPRQLTGTVTDGGKLTADPSVNLRQKPVDRVHELVLTGDMNEYNWGINSQQFDIENPFAHAFDIKEGERVQITFINHTMMWHPMHLHGHTFQVGDTGARKDTIIIKPMEIISVFFDADNPGQWLTHCHNAYHAERGMMGVFSYIK